MKRHDRAKQIKDVKQDEGRSLFTIKCAILKYCNQKVLLSTQQNSCCLLQFMYFCNLRHENCDSVTMRYDMTILMNE